VLGNVSPPPPFGIGDDCAVLPASRRRQLVTTDPVIFGRHFDDSVPPCAVGAKLLKRNLSDLAAMGARPTPPSSPSRLIRVSARDGLKVPSGTCRRRAAVLGCCGRRRCGSSDGFSAHSSPVRRSGGTAVVLRTGARLATGSTSRTLGGSLLGHHCGRPAAGRGEWLSRRDEVRAMMDVSDGLAKTPRADPCVPGRRRGSRGSDQHRRPCARRCTGQPPLRHALCDGELRPSLPSPAAPTARRWSARGAQVSAPPPHPPRALRPVGRSPPARSTCRFQGYDTCSRFRRTPESKESPAAPPADSQPFE